jgi:hypothetical protein
MTPLPHWNTLPQKPQSTRTLPKQFRITHTQAALLEQRLKGKSSALVRVLLSLYFNKKLEYLKFQGIDISTLLEKELSEAQEAVIKGAEKGTRKLKSVAVAKRNGTF